MSDRARLLLGDVGGTWIRFAQAAAEGPLVGLRTLPAAQFAGLAEAVARYRELEALPAGAFDAAAFAVAGPVSGDMVELTNLPWMLSGEALRDALGLTRLVLLNDLDAVARALPRLAPADLHELRAGRPDPRAPLAIVAPGTGLGMAAAIPTADGWASLAGEGGHRDLAAADEREWRVVERLIDRFGRASAERAVSGPGLVAIHDALRALDGLAPAGGSPAEIARRAVAGDAPRAGEAARLFSGWLGALGGDLVLTLGARGGLHLAGGMLAAMGAAFDRQRCLARFLAKGRFAAYLGDVPVRQIVHPAPALLGARKALLDGSSADR